MRRFLPLCATGNNVSPMFNQYVDSKYYINFIEELTTPIQEFVVQVFMISFLIWIIPLLYKFIREIVFKKEQTYYERLQKLFAFKK